MRLVVRLAAACDASLCRGRASPSCRPPPPMGTTCSIGSSGPSSSAASCENALSGVATGSAFCFGNTPTTSQTGQPLAWCGLPKAACITDDAKGLSFSPYWNYPTPGACIVPAPTTLSTTLPAPTTPPYVPHAKTVVAYKGVYAVPADGCESGATPVVFLDMYAGLVKGDSADSATYYAACAPTPATLVSAVLQAASSLDAKTKDTGVDPVNPPATAPPSTTTTTTGASSSSSSSSSHGMVIAVATATGLARRAAPPLAAAIAALGVSVMRDAVGGFV